MLWYLSDSRFPTAAFVMACSQQLRSRGPRCFLSMTTIMSRLDNMEFYTVKVDASGFFPGLWGWVRPSSSSAKGPKPAGQRSVFAETYMTLPHHWHRLLRAWVLFLEY